MPSPQETICSRLESLAAQVEFLSAQLQNGQYISYDPLVQEVTVALTEAAHMPMTLPLVDSVRRLRTAVDQLSQTVVQQQEKIKANLQHVDVSNRSTKAYHTIANLGRTRK